MPLKRPTGEALAAALAAATGYVFRDFSLMSRALTHSSAQGKNVENNERLEFLGDRVLGLVVSTCSMPPARTPIRGNSRSASTRW